jgi:hypothetical protein
MVSDANFFDLNENQRKLLKQIYDKFEHPDEAILEELVKLTGLNIMIVKAWFKNERKKAKKEQKEEMKREKKLLKKRNKQNGKVGFLYEINSIYVLISAIGFELFGFIRPQFILIS